MQSQKMFDALSFINPSLIIPVLEHGLEIEKLHLKINQDSAEIQERIYDTEILLTFLYFGRFRQ